MKNSLKTISVLLFLLILSCYANYLFQQSIIEKGLKLNPSTNIIVFGDSHSAAAFDPEFISNSQNLSNWGESIFFTYYKLKRLIENNPEHKELTVILALSYHSLYKDRENMYDSIQRPKIIQEYYSLLDDDGLDILKRKGTEYWLTKMKFDLGVPFNFKTNLEKYQGKVPFFTAGFEVNKTSHDVSIAHAILKLKDHFENKQNPEMSSLLLAYLNNTIQLAKENNIRIVIANTPLYKYYRDVVPNIVLSDYKRTIDKITDENPSTRFFDFTNSISDSTLFFDTDHLNAAGARRFSIKMDSCLKSTR